MALNQSALDEIAAMLKNGEAVSRGQRNARWVSLEWTVNVQGGPMAAHFTKEQGALAHRLRAKGGTLREIAKQISCSGPSHLHVVLSGKQLRDGSTDHWVPRLGRLTLDEREAIALGLKTGMSMSAIARGLGRSPSTVTREVANNGGRDGYRIWRAHQRARECAKRR